MPAGLRYGFPPQRRLRKRREFLEVQKLGDKVHSRHFVVLRRARPDARAASRLGITVSKRVGCAVTRNRIKRWLREFVRQSDWIGSGSDVVVIAKRSASELRNLRQVADDLSQLGALSQ